METVYSVLLIMLIIIIIVMLSDMYHSV